MIVATDPESLRHRLPEQAVKCADSLAGRNVIVVLEEGDDVQRDFPQVGTYGLLTHLDDHWQEPFESVLTVSCESRRYFIAALAASRVPTIVIVPDEPWVDDRLLLVMRVEGEEVTHEGLAQRTEPAAAG